MIILFIHVLYITSNYHNYSLLPTFLIHYLLSFFVPVTDLKLETRSTVTRFFSRAQCLSTAPLTGRSLHRSQPILRRRRAFKRANRNGRIADRTGPALIRVGWVQVEISCTGFPIPEICRSCASQLIVFPSNASCLFELL